MANEREDGVADYFGLVAETVEVKFCAIEGRGYGGSDMGGDDATLCLCPSESGFCIDAAVYIGSIIKDLR